MRFPIYRNYFFVVQDKHGQPKSEVRGAHARTWLLPTPDLKGLREVCLACAADKQVSWDVDESLEISDGAVSRINLRLDEKPWSKEKCN